MNRREIRERIEEFLQDAENRRWTNSEINRYIDDSQREFVRISRYPQISTFVPLSSKSANTISGTAAIDGRTITVTTSTAHGLSTGHFIIVSNQHTYEITVISDTTFRYVGDLPVEPGSFDFLPINPIITVPSNLEEVVSASLDGINLAIMSEGELNAAVFRLSSGGSFLDGVFGVVPNPFTTIKARYTVNTTPKWKERNGSCEAIVYNYASQKDFRIFPIPSHNEDLFVDPTATTKVFKEIELRGLPKIIDAENDATEPIIGQYYQEALIFGSLDRAYSREGQTRNIEKSQIYRARFIELAMEAKMNEGINSLSRSEGRNESFFRVVR
ncbi:MAG: hypothetical protein CL429_00850 [Acidimicrobiaceae bacterium]|nr:hypothetical protein [Acidimicrobiaceae bacterium]